MSLKTKSSILRKLNFGFVGKYMVAGMGEPWVRYLDETHALLKSLSIRAIVILTEDNLYGAHHLRAGFETLHEPIDDCHPPSLEGMVRVSTFIDTALSNNVGVVVHCLEGRGRTGVILGGWLGKREQLSAVETIRRIRQLRPVTALTRDQKSFLHKYLEPA